MSSFVFILLGAINGAVCVNANVNVSSWQYWAILGCMCGAYFCGTMRNK